MMKIGLIIYAKCHKNSCIFFLPTRTSKELCTNKRTEKKYSLTQMKTSSPAISRNYKIPKKSFSICRHLKNWSNNFLSITSWCIVRGRPKTTLTVFHPILTTYLPIVDVRWHLNMYLPNVNVDISIYMCVFLLLVVRKSDFFQM